MSNYWKKKLEELNAQTKKNKSRGTPALSVEPDDYFQQKLTELKVQEKQTDDLAPIFTPVSAPVAEKKEEKKWYQNFFQKGAFEDGYQPGDILATIGGTVADAGVGLLKGFGKTVEGVSDAISYGVAGVADLVGADDTADYWREVAKHDAVGSMTKGVDDKLDDYSVLGDTGDSVMEGLGQVATVILTGGAAGALGAGAIGTTAATTGLMGVSSFGSGTSEAYQGGATDGEAHAYGAMKGVVDAGTELIFGGLGKGIKALGISKGLSSLDDMAAKKLSSKISNTFFSNLTEWGVKSSAEGLEEVLAGIGTAAAKKATYMSDEEFKTLLADENLMEQFAVGAITSGISQSGVVPGMKKGSLIETTKKGQDFVTGLNKNENSVIDKVYNDRLAEAEADGNKLNKRDKTKLYDEVMEDMEKGYISTDTIEEVLGGDSYKSYKDTVDSEQAILKEFEELGKKTNPTLADQSRYAELQEQVKQIKENPQSNQFRTKLNEEMLGIVKDSRLAESYNEKARRGQSFEADLTKYKGNQAEVVKKAVESGILNNTRRTHEFVDMVSKISADKGVLFDFTNNEKLKESGFAIDGKTINGYVTKDGITLNTNSKKALNTVVGHEITHVLEGTELYAEMQKSLFEYAKSKNDYQGRYDTLAKLYEGVKGANVDAELTADLVGDYLFTDSNFVNHLSAKNRNVFQKIYDEIKYLCKIATAGSKEKRDLEKVKRAFDKAYKQSGKVSGDTKYSLSDSDGKKLTQEQAEYFKDSKMRDEDGNLKVMYHGSQDAGFHEFDPSRSDDDISLFFVDSNDVAASYSGTSETYEAQTIRTAEDMNNFIDSIGAEDYEVVEKDGKFTLLYEGDRVADSKTAQGIYEEFCWYEGVGEGDANYKVYLNLINPLVVDAEGRNWNNISREFSKEVYDRYKSLTAEEKAALSNLAEWGEYSIFKDEMLEARATAEQGGSGVFDEAYTKNLARAYEKLGGANANLYDAFSIAQENFSEESLKEFAVKQMNTRDYAKKAKAEGYDGVIFKNIHDNGGYSNGSEGASTVAIAFNSNQIKSVANEKPTGDADIRFSLSEDSEGRTLSDEQKKYFKESKVVDENGNLKVVYHGSPSDFNTFSLDYLGTNGTAEGYGFYFTDSKLIAEGYSKGREGQQDDQHKGKLFEVYLDIKKPLSDAEVTMSRAQFKKFLIELNKQTDVDGEPLDILSNYGDVEWEGLNNVLNYAMEIEYDASDSDTNMIHSIINGCGDMKTVFRVLREVTGYDGIIVDKATWGGDQSIYLAFHPEQIKNVDNLNPTSDPDTRRSLSKNNEAPVKRGNYNVYGDDIRLDAPVREDISKTETTTEEVAEDSTGTVSKMEQVEDFAPLPTSHDLRARQAELENQIRAAYDAKDQETVEKLMAEHDGLLEQIRRLEAEENAMESDRLNSLDDADAPPETESPYYGEDENAAPVVDPFEERDIKDVGKRNVKAYMYENPEVKPFFQAEAELMLADLHRSIKGERFYTAVEGGVPGTYGAESYGVWSGVSRHVHPDIEYLLDNLHYSYAEIENGLKAIIEDNGKENNACSKRIEFILNDRLLKGSVDMDYPTAEEFATPPNQEYINLLKEKDIKEYNEEARKKFFDVADEYAPAEDDFAPVAESEPKQEQTESETAPKKETETVTSDIRNNRAKEVFNSIKKLSSGKYHKVGDYGFHMARNSKNESVTITIKTPDGEKLRRVINGGNFWKNYRLWAEAANMVANHEYPNVEQRTSADEVEGKIAKIVTHDQEPAPKKRSGFMKFRNNVLDKFSVIEDISLEHKNRELYAKANYMRSAENRAQRFIGKGVKSEGVRSLNELRTEVENSGLYDEFQEYMYDMHNTDRMSLEEKARPTIERLRGKFENLRMEQIRAIAAKEITDKTTDQTAQTIKDARDYLKAIGTRNMPVRGFDYTADISRANAARAEAEHPQFKKWAQDVYKINEFLREKLVADGEISRETADLWAEIYPHYVPIRRLDKSGVGVSVPLDTNKTGVDAPIKRATGGDSDIGDLFKTLAMRAEQTFKAGARNSFGLELKNTLGSKAISQTETTLDEMTDSVENHEERLKKGENGGNPTFTVFENGKRVEFEITEDVFDALKPTNDLFSGTNKVLNTASEVQRKILTEWNLMFTAGNFAKDMQDAFVNSKHAVATYKEIPEAIKELFSESRGNGGKWIAEYLDNGGERLTYFDGREKTFTEDDTGIKKVLGYVPRKISDANNFVERIPRLAEYIASRKAGASIEVAMLDAAQVTTNFAAGGDATKWANRNGFTFLNASIQGFNQQVRNIREAKANGLKGMMTLAAKVAAAGLPVLLLNHLIWGDDEEYEELSDYVKDNYYIVGKFGDGKFVRIPKGRTVAVIQNAFEQMSNLITGNDEVDLQRFGELLVNNLAPNNPLENNVIAPIKNVFDNKTWYGDDLVPTRLQDLPKAEQFDETTDAISKWLGENLGALGIDASPYKINYLLDQYSGGIGDVFLPMLTPESDGGGFLAPWSDKFTTDSVMKNQNVSDFYDTVDELTANAKSAYATDEDVLKYKYMNSVNSTLGDLYAQKREIQNGNLSDAEKDAAVRAIQKQIDALAKESLETYNNISYEGNGEYAVIGNQYYQWYTPEKGEAYWRKLNNEQVVKYNLTKNAGNAHYVTDGNVHYRLDENGDWTKISDRQLQRQKEVTKALGITPNEYWSKTEISFMPLSNGEYEYAFENPDKYAIAKAVGGFDAFMSYSSELYNIKADKDEYGKSISGSRKDKIIDWLNGRDDIEYGAKLLLFKSEYPADDTYNYEIIEYLNNRDDISYQQMKTILKELGFTVHADGFISWD